MQNSKKYNVIYCDPPWSYTQKSAGRGNLSGAIDKYDLMDNEDIMRLPVKKISLPESVCFMWATTPLLDVAFDTLSAWGFKYKTMIVWEKTGLLGMGNWMRTQTEFILIGIRGKVKPFKDQRRNIFRHPICEHSAKPHFFRELIKDLSGKSIAEPIRLEMFARSRDGLFPDYEYEGWDVFGNEVNNSVQLFKSA